ncbi:MAG: hypothetical protein JOY68_06580, partial [Candidatus Dormibacteraeota bacterium]|nr:hypothetical protein [Candidatus Dormibacteraeota bacterium]
VELREAADYPDAQKLVGWMEERDVLVVPVTAHPAPRIAHWRTSGWLRTGVAVARWMGFAPPWNLAGCPAVAIPVLTGQSGLPVGVQIVGPPRTELTLLAIAAQLGRLLTTSS